MLITIGTRFLIDNSTLMGVMTPLWTKRKFLQISAAAIGVVSTGCSQQTADDNISTTSNSNKSTDTKSNSLTITRTTTSEIEINTPSPDECSEEKPPYPTDTNSELKPKSYPSYPSSLNLNKVKEFAVDFEKAYQHNNFLINNYIPETDEVTILAGVPEWATYEVQDGYVLGVNGELKTATREPTKTNKTQAPFLDTSFGSWYYLTTDFALRNEIDELDRVSSPSFGNQQTIFCN